MPAHHLFRTCLFISCMIACFRSDISAQSTGYLQNRNILYKTLKDRSIGPWYMESIDRFYNKTCDSLIRKTKTFEGVSTEIILSRLFVSCSEEIRRQTITRPRIPLVNALFMETIRNYRLKGFRAIYRSAGIIPCRILGYAFQGTAIGDSIQDIASVREMVRYPHFIATRILQPRFERFRDTLLYFMANRAPQTLINKINERDPDFIKLTEKSRNRTVRAIATLNDDINISRILPFAMAIFENRTTFDKARLLAKNPPALYDSFTSEIVYLKNHPDPETRNFLRLPIDAINANLARDFYINEINDLHEKPDHIRFKAVEGLSARELYFLILGGEDDMYTSSFMHLFRLFLKKTEREGLAHFLEHMAYYNFDRFLSILTTYGMEHELIQHLNEPLFAAVMNKYLSALADPQLTDVDLIVDAMYLAEILEKTKDFPHAASLMSLKLDSLQGQNKRDDLLFRMFGGLCDILSGSGQILHEADTHIYDELAISQLKSGNVVTEVSLFYDDEDGATSFESFCATFAAADWQKEDKGNYVLFTSKKGINRIRAYASKPCTKAGYDTAQKEMMEAAASGGNTVTVFIHRGHSYYLPNSLSMLPAEAQLVYLGSCGGYQNLMSVFSSNPDAQLIVTRKIGSKLINDPLLQKIHQDILQNTDISWREYWTYFENHFQSKHLKDLFSGYTPPYKFYGLMFIRSVFNY